MSNPAVYLLHQNKIHGNVLRIEDNLGEAVHIHYGDSRFSLTVQEFENMCEAVEKAAKELFELEGFDWEAIDKTSLDWNWLCDYERIEKISMKQVRLGDLYTKRNIYRGEGFQRTIKLEDSLFVEELTYNKSDIDRYAEVNMGGQNSRERLRSMYEKIMEADYPFDGKYITVSSANNIFDGDHRAACLYIKHGADYEIPVIEIAFKGQESIESQLKSENKRYAKFIITAGFKKVKREIKNAVKKILGRSNKEKTSADSSSVIDISKVYQWFEENQAKYYFVGDRTLIVENLKSFAEAFKLGGCRAYDGYKLLYSISKPLSLKTNEGEFVVWDNLCCKSKFETSLLPLDKFCNEYAWNTCMKDANGINRASIETELIFAITYALLERLSFTEKEKKMIQDNIKVLDSDDFMTMMDKEFFGYKEPLTEMLKQNKFEECISRYVTNTSY